MDATAFCSSGFNWKVVHYYFNSNYGASSVQTLHLHRHLNLEDQRTPGQVHQETVDCIQGVERRNYASVWCGVFHSCLFAWKLSLAKRRRRKWPSEWLSRLRLNVVVLLLLLSTSRAFTVHSSHHPVQCKPLHYDNFFGQRTDFYVKLRPPLHCLTVRQQLIGLQGSQV